MKCQSVSLPGGGAAIVCTGRSSARRCCACKSRDATLLCDWKDGRKRSGTCDRPICERCSTKPAPGKDLCPQHAKAYEEWKAAR